MTRGDKRRHRLGSTTSGRVLKALSLFGSLQMLLVICSVVRNKCVALWLGTAGIGVFALYNYTLDLINQLVQLNIRQSGVREIASAAGGERSRMAAMVRRVSVILGVVGALLVLALSPLLNRWTFGDYAHTWSFALLSLSVGFNAVTSGEQAVLQASDRLKALARASAIGVTGGTAISVAMYRLWGMSGIVPSIITFVAVYFLAHYIISRRNVKSEAIATADALRRGRPMLRLGVYMTAGVAMSSLASYMLIAWLRSRSGESGVGLYQSGYAIINQYVGLVFIALGVEYFPRISSVARSRHRISIFLAHEIKLVMLLVLPLVMLFINAAPVVVRLLYSPEFDAVTPYLTVAAVGTVMKAASFVMAYVILARGDGRVYLATESISSIVFIATAMTGYHVGGLTGIAAGYVVWYAAYTLIVMAVCLRRYRLSGLWRPIGLTLAVAAAAALQSALCLSGCYLAATALTLLSAAASLSPLLRHLHRKTT